jgi:anion-transporting  ArsA/GET3 family ATPase
MCACVSAVVTDMTCEQVYSACSHAVVAASGSGEPCSCSIAIQFAKARRSVLIVSTDPAHNLSDAFDQKFASTPTPGASQRVACAGISFSARAVNGVPNLCAMEIDPKLARGKIPEQMSMFANVIDSIPGIDEVLNFANVMECVRSVVRNRRLLTLCCAWCIKAGEFDGL